MKILFKKDYWGLMIIFILPSLLNHVIAQDAKNEWTQQFRNPEDITCCSVVSDNVGNVYSTGYFTKTADFDPGEDSVILKSVEYADLFLCKFNPEGQFIWIKQFNGSHFNYFSYENSSVDTDKRGNVYLTGASTTQVKLDTLSGIYDLSAQTNNSNTLIAKLDSIGNYIWIKQIVGFVSHSRSIKADNDENVYLTGYFRDTLDFDPGPETFYLNSTWSDEYDVFVLKLNCNGEFLWAKQFGSSLRKAGTSIDVDKQGNVYTTGYYRIRCDFDPGIGDSILYAQSEADIFVSKLNSDGQFVWAKSFGGAGNDIGTDIVVDRWGNVFFSGYFSGLSDFDPSKKSHSCMSNGSSDAFICKLNTDGDFLWANQFGGNSIDQAISIDVDLNGDVYFNGVFNHKMDVDPGLETIYFTADGENDIFIIKLDKQGNYEWAKQFSGSQYKMTGGIDVNSKGDVLSAGYFKGEVDFNPDQDSCSLLSMGSKDAFVHKITQNITFESAISVLKSISKLKVYPNPTTDKVLIDFGRNIYYGRVRIINIKGKMTSSFDFSDVNKFEIELPKMPGLYFIEVETENEHWQAFKVLKKE